MRVPLPMVKLTFAIPPSAPFSEVSADAKTFTVQVKGDNKKEATEYFYLDLFGNSGNSLFTKNRGVGAILNDD